MTHRIANRMTRAALSCTFAMSVAASATAAGVPSLPAAQAAGLSSDRAGVPAAPAAPATAQTPAAPRSYVVNVGTGAAIGAARVAIVAAAVRQAGGTVVQSWPQVGVLVVHSSRADFTTRLRPSSQTRITSVGPTRTVPVSTPLRPRPAGSLALDAPLVPSLPAAMPQPVESTVQAAPAATTAAEPREREQWGLRAVGAAASAQAGSGITVAVVDSGIQPDHPDLAGRIDAARSVDCTDGGRPDSSRNRWRNTASGHGTHVAGIIAAARNGVGVAGIAPGARVASVKVVDDAGMIYPEYAICGILRTADSGLRIANHSYYIDPWRFWCASSPAQAPARESIRRAFAYATGHGVLSVAAAGNDSTDLARKTTDALSPNDSTPVSRRLDRSCIDLPAELPGVLTVSAADPKGTIADYSNYGRNVIDVLAPGSDILSTYPDSTWALLSGTSMAAPHASGVTALLASRQPLASPEELLVQVRRQARDVPCPRADARCTGTRADNSYAGEGMVDARRALSGR